MHRQTHRTMGSGQVDTDMRNGSDSGPAWADGPIEMQVTVGAARVETAMMQTQVSPAVRIPAWAIGRPPLVK